VRGEKLKGEPIWIDRAVKHPKVKVIWQTQVIKINGVKTVEAVELDSSFEGSKTLSVRGVFVEIGAAPATDLVKEFGVELNDRWRIKVDGEQRTNLPGVFAAGDVTDKTGHFEQIINSAAQGAKAAHSAFKYLQDNSHGTEIAK
jgi:thioredoxin reductase (NADPH)